MSAFANIKLPKSVLVSKIIFLFDLIEEEFPLLKRNFSSSANKFCYRFHPWAISNGPKERSHIINSVDGKSTVARQMMMAKECEKDVFSLAQLKIDSK